MEAIGPYLPPDPPDVDAPDRADLVEMAYAAAELEAARTMVAFAAWQAAVRTAFERAGYDVDGEDLQPEISAALAALPGGETHGPCQ